MVDRKLGRGLDFFLSGGQRAAPPPPAGASTGGRPVPETATGPETRLVEASLLTPNPQQPRRTFGEAELAELTNSIRASGVLQPILVRRVGKALEIVAGERRWRAAQAAGLSEVPVLIRDASDQESAVFALVENLQREDLNPMDKAQAFRLLIEKTGVTQDEVAQRVGLDRSTVANFVRLLDLAPEVQAHVSRGTLSMGHARALAGLADAQLQVRLADEVVREHLSVRSLEDQIRGRKSTEALDSAGSKRPAPAREAWLSEIEETLRETFGTNVAVRYGRKRSTILIECAGREEFERILGRLKNG